jgi:ABC-type transport system substrate-binding protein
LPGARPGTCELCTLNASGARQRLEAAQVDQLSLWFNAGGGHELVRDALRAVLSDIGVSLVSNGRQPAPPLPDYQALLADGGLGLFRLPLVADVPSGLAVLLPLLHRAATPSAGGQNAMRYDDPTVTALLDQAARTVNDRTRERLLRRIEDIALNVDHVVIPVVTYHHTMVAAADVEGLRYGPFGLVDLPALTIR